MTSLPNLHPAVVHFPIALFFGALLLDWVGLLARKLKWLDPAAAALYVMAAAGAAGAYRSGRAAEDSIVGVSAEVTPLIAEHADWAWWALWAVAAVAAARAALAWFDRRVPERGLMTARLALLAAACAGGWILFQTAEHGGALVYGHGVAVAVTAREEPRADAGPPPGDLAPGTPAEPRPGAEEITAPFSRAYPGEFGDVQVEVRADLSRFEGTLRIAHHVSGETSGGSFDVGTDGRTALLRVSGDRKDVLAEATTKVPAGPVTLALISSGTHLKGMLDGVVVVHGHGDPGPPGVVGLSLEGTGTVRLFSVSVTPLQKG